MQTHPGPTLEDHPAPAPTASNEAQSPAPPPAEDGEEISPCPNCGAPMYAVRGSKQAICGNCGFKDSCCF
ncbi:MAG TPA: hypothetical protein VFM49_29370 [Chloroflexia bacterium]|nr:hypothetical protein [Chloroflexia bacterium]